MLNIIVAAGMRQPVSRSINCGSKAEIAQVVSTVETRWRELKL